MMIVGSDKAVSGPNEPPPVKPGHRGQLARLIRERLVFVNLPGQVRAKCVTCQADPSSCAASSVVDPRPSDPKALLKS